MPQKAPIWITATLLVAAMYNVVWGAWVILAPDSYFRWIGMEPVNHPSVWQSVGMIVGVYGIGYAIAARNPFRHWPIILVGLLGKVFGPVGFLYGYATGSLPLSFGWTLLTNDLIWWIPFTMILYQAFRWNTDPANDGQSSSFEDAIRSVRSQRSETLEKLSFKRPTLIVFLRHAGCTFCRQTLADLQRIREELDRLQVSVAMVHMGSPMDGTIMLSKYDLDYFHHFSDPHCHLYRAFGLERGTLAQVLSPAVLFRGIRAALQGGHGIGRLQGDGFQLPGVFVMYDGKVIIARPANDASERFDYLELASKARDLVGSTSAVPERSKNDFHAREHRGASVKSQTGDGFVKSKQ